MRCSLLAWYRNTREREREIGRERGIGGHRTEPRYGREACGISLHGPSRYLTKCWWDSVCFPSFLRTLPLPAPHLCASTVSHTKPDCNDLEYFNAFQLREIVRELVQLPQPLVRLVKLAEIICPNLLHAVADSLLLARITAVALLQCPGKHAGKQPELLFESVHACSDGGNLARFRSVVESIDDVISN